MRGRVAANKCRRKKKETEAQLLNKVKELIAARDELVESDRLLRQQMQEQWDELLKHCNPDCGCIASPSASADLGVDGDGRPRKAHKPAASTAELAAATARIMAYKGEPIVPWESTVKLEAHLEMPQGGTELPEAPPNEPQGGTALPEATPNEPQGETGMPDATLPEPTTIGSPVVDFNAPLSPSEMLFGIPNLI